VSDGYSVSLGGFGSGLWATLLVVSDGYSVSLGGFGSGLWATLLVSDGYSEVIGAQEMIVVLSGG
jgi:hypothetical protein